MFSILTDDAALVHNAVADLMTKSATGRIFVRRVSATHWKAVGHEIPEGDANMMIPILPEDEHV